MTNDTSPASGEARVSLALLDDLLESCQIVGFDGRFLYLNEEAARQAGRPKAELVGRRMTECVPGIAETPMFAMVMRGMKERAVLEMQTEVSLADGTKALRKLRCVPHPDGVCLFSLDIERWGQTEVTSERDSRLRQSEERFARLSEAGVIGIVVSDLHGAVAEINDTLLQLIGYERAEMLGGALRWTDLTPPEWRAVDARAVEDLRASGVASLREKEYLRKDGTRVAVLVGSALLRGEVEQAISFVLDITERKNAAPAVARLLQERAVDVRFRDLLDAAPDAMVIVDEEDRIALVNAQTENLFGYSRGELLGKPVVMLAPARFSVLPEHHRAAYFREHPAAGPTGTYELWGRRKDGTEFPIEMSLSPLRSEHRTVTSRAIRDVSARKDTEKRLRESEERFRLTIEGVRDYAIFLLDADGRIASWNLGAERMKGYAPDEIVGQHFSRFYSADEVRRGKPDAELEIAKAEGRFEEEGWRIRKDGSRFMAHVVITSVTDAEGKLVGFSKVTRDVTQRHLAENALRAANRELEAFSYSVAHDLRAPVRVMSGFAQLLMDTYGDALDAEGRDWLQEITDNARKMGELIEALLALARLNRVDLTPALVDLAELVRSKVDVLAAAGESPPTELVCPATLPAEIDPRLARVLVENLIDNAWKFTRRVSAPRIELGRLDHASEPTFFVRDNGAGFDMAYAQKLFVPFQRLHAAGEFPGTGVGLATVQRIVDRHGGRIWTEAAVGSGATFYFTLPAQIPTPSPA